MGETAGTIASVVGAAAQAAGTVKSMTDSTPKVPKADKEAMAAPTRDSAAASLTASQTDEDRRRRLVSQGMSSNMLTGATGVLSAKENTGKITLGGS